MQGFLKLIVLKELEQQAQSGYSLIQQIAADTGKKPSTGSIYPILAEFLKKEFIKQEEDGRKKIYSLTRKGKNHIKELRVEKQQLFAKYIEFIRHISELSGEEVTIPKTCNIQESHKFIKSIFAPYAQVEISLVNHSSAPYDEARAKKVKQILTKAAKQLKELQP